MNERVTCQRYFELHAPNECNINKFEICMVYLYQCSLIDHFPSILTQYTRTITISRRRSRRKRELEREREKINEKWSRETDKMKNIAKAMCNNAQ